MRVQSILLTLAVTTVASTSPYNARPYTEAWSTKQEYGSESNNASATQVDLGYAVYQGFTNASSQLNIFKGIRYADPPVGRLRWQAPRPPAVNRSEVLQATEYGPICPQSPNSAGTAPRVVSQVNASEDCLSLNVWTPSNAAGLLPVFVWIHGGGYGTNNGRRDQMQALIAANNHSFVGVSIQYRLGAFGFLASDEVYRKGVVNAGLLDQHLALQWIQQYIHLFNGDATRVTIGGLSAGAGSVMLLDMAFGGSIGTQLFTQSFAASPYLPTQYGYKDWIPSQSYYAFANEAGCDTNLPYGAANGTKRTRQIFECLQHASSEVLMNASATVSQQAFHGAWAFLPVTDGTFVQDLPSRQLGRGKVNGLRALIGNNAEEGPYFVPQTIDTKAEFASWLRGLFPLSTGNDISKILRYYPSDGHTNQNSTLYATNGQTGPTAMNQSIVATGWQQRAYNIYAETTFICPSYWLTEAYSNAASNRKGYRYQFSVIPALHAADASVYFSWESDGRYTPEIRRAFQRLLGNYVKTGDPTIADGSAASKWPPYTIAQPYQININTTCGAGRTPFPDVPSLDLCSGPGVENDIRLVDAYSWEGGRGERCDFWKSVGGLVPE